MTKVIDEILKLQNNVLNLLKENNDYQTKILKVIKLLKKYNNKEANYYAPVQEVLDILEGDE